MSRLTRSSFLVVIAATGVLAVALLPGSSYTANDVQHADTHPAVAVPVSTADDSSFAAKAAMPGQTPTENSAAFGLLEIKLDMDPASVARRAATKDVVCPGTEPCGP